MAVQPFSHSIIQYYIQIVNKFIKLCTEAEYCGTQRKEQVQRQQIAVLSAFFKHIQHTVIFRKIRNKKCIRQYSLNELCKTYNFLQKISTPANIHIREEVKIVI